MTDPTVDGWTLPEDLYAAPIVILEDGMGLTFKAKAFPEHPHDDERYVALRVDDPIVTADDLLTIAARLTQLAHAIQPPTHDPDAEEWTFTWDGDYSPRSTGMTKAEAQARADRWANVMPDDAPYRVVHVSELAHAINPPTHDPDAAEWCWF